MATVEEQRGTMPDLPMGPFGNGGWTLKRAVVADRVVYGVCAQSTPEHSDIICIQPAPESQAVATVSIHNSKDLSSAGKVTFIFSSEGNWDDASEDHFAFEKVSTLPLGSGAGVVHTTERPASFEGRLREAADKSSDTPILRISIFPHNSRKPFATIFFNVHGFLQAWAALLVNRNGSYALLYQAKRDATDRQPR